jgi:hypothetical protein
MAKYATGKHAKAISDRSGVEFPYREMLELIEQNHQQLLEYLTTVLKLMKQVLEL